MVSAEKMSLREGRVVLWTLECHPHSQLSTTTESPQF